VCKKVCFHGFGSTIPDDPRTRKPDADRPPLSPSAASHHTLLGMAHPAASAKSSAAAPVNPSDIANFANCPSDDGSLGANTTKNGDGSVRTQSAIPSSRECRAARVKVDQWLVFRRRSISPSFAGECSSRSRGKSAWYRCVKGLRGCVAWAEVIGAQFSVDEL